ncbi:hypothetical protein F2981_02525 [Sinorhizobium meliloti]|nr:hypothetical protein [Sinorhizobium meliloti]
MASPQAYDAIHDYLVAAWGAATPLPSRTMVFAAPSDPEHWIYVEIVLAISSNREHRRRDPDCQPLARGRHDLRAW